MEKADVDGNVEIIIYSIKHYSLYSYFKDSFLASHEIYAKISYAKAARLTLYNILAQMQQTALHIQRVVEILSKKYNEIGQ